MQLLISMDLRTSIQNHHLNVFSFVKKLFVCLEILEMSMYSNYRFGLGLWSSEQGSTTLIEFINCPAYNNPILLAPCVYHTATDSQVPMKNLLKTSSITCMKVRHFSGVDIVVFHSDFNLTLSPTFFPVGAIEILIKQQLNILTLSLSFLK
jgi:hypothetical protein